MATTSPRQRHTLWLLRLLVGYRDDVDLAASWWHRAATVAFVLGFLAVFTLVTFLSFTDRVRRPLAADVEILTTMTEVMLRNYPARRTSHIQDFQEGGGAGGRREGVRIEPVELNSSSVNCFVATLATQASGQPEPVPMCFDGSRPLDTDILVRYRVTPFHAARIWAVSSGKGLLWAIGLSMPILLLYYRGVVHIICGPRDRTHGPSDAQLT